MVKSLENNVVVHGKGHFHWVGNGFPVRSVFGYNDLGQELSPFLLLDYAAPYNFPPGNEKRGVGAHPHRGFETVTIAYQGEIEHRDSSGGGGIIGPGDVQWMTAASGLVHDEFHSKKFTEAGGDFEMVQLWVNLPAKYKKADPAYQTILSSTIPTVNLPNGVGQVRVIAGSYESHKGPARTFTPINLWDVSLLPNSSATLTLTEGHTKAILVIRGELEINNKIAKEAELAVVDRESTQISLNSKSEVKLLVLSGEPINEPIVGYGPFVMNTEKEIEEAFKDYQKGGLGSLE